jgi:hypothetical protein
VSSDQPGYNHAVIFTDIFTVNPQASLYKFKLIVLILAVFYLFSVTLSLAANAPPRLSSDTDVATAGFFRLTWETDADRIELQQASKGDFRKPVTLYIGSDRASVVSGKPNGTWFYRIRAINDGQPGPWSKPVKVTVAHHSLYRAFTFLSLGIIVFISIVVVVIRGSRES